MAEVVGIAQARERHENAARLKEREAFESELQEETRRRLYVCIRNAIKMRTGGYDPRLHAAILRNLLEKFMRDKEPLLENFTELRQLPIGEESRMRRLVAFECAVHHYLPEVLREEFQRAGLLAMSQDNNEHPFADHWETSDAS
jgi:hypothetical protein